MIFRRKGWLRKRFDEQLMKDLLSLKEAWSRQKNLVEKSVEPSPEVLFDLQVAEAKYFYLLREAKKRSVKAGAFEK